MSYREQAPPPMLAAWVQCTWQRSGDGGPPVRVVPDGCLGRAAVEAGYADHPHFANDCRDLAGVSPSVLLAC